MDGKAPEAADQVLLAGMWLRRYPTRDVLGHLFGVSDSAVSRSPERLCKLRNSGLTQSHRATEREKKKGLSVAFSILCGSV